MFTGIIQDIGKIIKKNTQEENILWEIQTKVAIDTKIGGSISINGACHTVIEKKGDIFLTESMKETLEKTNLGFLENESFVNIEPSMKLGDSLDGHMVQGHIDGMGEIVEINKKGNSWDIMVLCSKEILNLCVYKGSICVDGISLTISKMKENAFVVSIISHTFKNTIMQYYRIGNKVNIETDVLVRYVRKWEMRREESIVENEM